MPPFHDEPAPADFRIRVSRNARGIGARRRSKHRGRRIAALAAAIAVPAFAAPGDWQPLQALGSQETAITASAAPMPFEQPGSSFPGSAFYYLEDAPRMELAASTAATPLFDITGTGSLEAEQLAASRNAGPAARSFMASGDGVAKARALQCLTSAIYYEAASETAGGQRAVAQVVLNRVAHPSYPGSVCGVVYQGSERSTGCQFSFTCDGSLARKPAAAAWDRARRIAQDALLGEVYQPVGLATHYHTIWIDPYWADSLHPVGTIGAHRFYRWRGAAGQPGAFRTSYSGYEPPAAASARSAGAIDAVPAAPPIATARPRTPASIQAAPPPSYPAAVTERGGDRLFKAENLPEASGIRPEYANSGRWISEPK
ncbi:cell wall hydrolase [Allopontixanthobacter sp.]|uniref:cell wall hydrolase n=1 Tax=Allopontixanthobacter sp. TaxID=2906452 RepID=UPI002ABA1DB2|nr:cell wall hydrolase [Allopontixanthobacter sp.]MDZ4306291.1 cell wall hydrolase [Allopontixanthobacter sp.]